MIPPIASRFVAGESAAGALDHARRMNDDGVAVILNLLGEHYAERAPADEDAAAYVDLVEDIASTGIDACVSVKPSQIGLDAGDHVDCARVGDGRDRLAGLHHGADDQRAGGGLHPAGKADQLAHEQRSRHPDVGVLLRRGGF